MMGALIERNEEAILKDTLDHMAPMCDQGIIAYDDASTDGSVDILKAHDAVFEIIRARSWDPVNVSHQFTEHARMMAERVTARGATWILLMAADERIELESIDLEGLQRGCCDSVFMRLFDAYMTPGDETPWRGDGSCKHPEGRAWWGPGYRHRMPFFRLHPGLRWWVGESFEPVGLVRPRMHGCIRHMSRGISPERWDADVEHYLRDFPLWAHAGHWVHRKGKAVRADYTSVYGKPLIRWKERHDKGVPLRC